MVDFILKRSPARRTPLYEKAAWVGFCVITRITRRDKEWRQGCHHVSPGIPVSNWNFDKSDFRTLFGFYRSALKTARVSAHGTSTKCETNRELF